MAKAEILTHIGEGQYRISLKYAVERVLEELTRINERIAELAVEVPNQKVVVLDNEAKVASIKAQIDATIPDYQNGVEGSEKKIRDLQLDLVKASGELASSEYRRDLLVAENLALLKRRTQIERIPEQKEIDAWCADYSTELSGEVGVVDINDEGGQGVVIKPGFTDEAAYSATADGVLMPREAQSGHQVYFNAAIMPGVQKWFPRYRLGTITSLNGDTCNVSLLAAQSSEQDLNINQTNTLNDIPIQYMDCNGDAFEEGDTVVVRYTQSGPLVVGFYTNPRECDLGTFAFIPAQYYNANMRVFGEPAIDGDPLGTSQGPNPGWFMKPSGNDWDITKYQPMNFGVHDWQGPDGLVLSWRAAPGRCYLSWFITLDVQNFYLRSPEVYCKGNVVADVDDLVTGAVVYGAGVQGNTLTVIARDFVTWHVIQYPWENNNTTGGGTLVDSFPLETDFIPASGWYFNRSGTEAVITMHKDRESVIKINYLVGTGAKAPEVLWERGYEGTGTRQDIEEEGKFLPVQQTYWWDQVQHQIPLYVDFIGDQEVTLSIEHAPYSYVGDLDSNADVYQVTEYQASVSFVLSTGEVLATIGPYESRSYYLSNSDTDGEGGVDEMSLVEREQTRFVTGENHFFDIRNKAVMLQVLETDYSADFTGAPDAEGQVAGVRSTQTSVSYEMFVAGARVFQKRLQEVSSTISDSIQFRNPPDVIGGTLGDILGPQAPKLAVGESLVNVGFQKSGSKQIATVFIRYPESFSTTGVEETAYENQITGFSNVELELFGGREDMTIYGLSRV